MKYLFSYVPLLQNIQPLHPLYNTLNLYFPNSLPIQSQTLKFQSPNHPQSQPQQIDEVIDLQIIIQQFEKFTCFRYFSTLSNPLWNWFSVTLNLGPQVPAFTIGYPSFLSLGKASLKLFTPLIIFFSFSAAQSLSPGSRTSLAIGSKIRDYSINSGISFSNFGTSFTMSSGLSPPSISFSISSAIWTSLPLVMMSTRVFWVLHSTTEPLRIAQATTRQADIFMICIIKEGFGVFIVEKLLFLGSMNSFHVSLSGQLPDQHFEFPQKTNLSQLYPHNTNPSNSHPISPARTLSQPKKEESPRRFFRTQEDKNRTFSPYQYPTNLPLPIIIMKSFIPVCLLALICSTFAYKEASATKLLQIVTSGKINQLTELCDRLNDNKYQVKDIIQAVPEFENLLADVINELLVMLPLIKDVVPFVARPFVEKSERLTYKALGLVKQNLKVIQANAQRIIDVSEDLTHLQIRPDQIETFFNITQEVLDKISVPQC